jgi:hypothetical protein
MVDLVLTEVLFQDRARQGAPVSHHPNVLQLLQHRPVFLPVNDLRSIVSWSLPRRYVLC